MLHFEGPALPKNDQSTNLNTSTSIKYKIDHFNSIGNKNPYALERPLIEQNGSVRDRIKQFEGYIQNSSSQIIDIKDLKKEVAERKERNFPFNELLMTEETYRKGLDHLSQLCEEYRENKNSWLKLINKNERKNFESSFDEFFNAIEEIKDISDFLFEDLNKLSERNNLMDFTSRIKHFEDKYSGVDFDVFGKYMQLNDEICRLLNIHHATKIENPLIKILDTLSNKLSNHSFMTNAILPIQRLPRYELMFKEMLKRVPQDSEVSEILKGLLQVTQDNISKYNEDLRSFTKARALSNSQKENLKSPEKFTESKENCINIFTNKKVINKNGKINEKKIQRMTNKMKKTDEKVQKYQAKLKKQQAAK